MPTITVHIALVWWHKKHHNYQFSKDGRCFNVKTGRELKQVLNSRCLGYCIKGKFRSLKRLRKELEAIPKYEYSPF